MELDLVAVATYPTTAEAGLACEILESEGIACRVGDEMVVEWFWYLSNAVGGVKVLVAAKDLERARVCLKERGSDLLAELGAEDSADFEEEDENAFPGDPTARRAWLASIIGLFVCPPMLHFYSAWLLLRVSFAEQPLSPRGTRRFYGAWLVNVVVCALTGLIPLLSLAWMSRFWANIGHTLLQWNRV